MVRKAIMRRNYDPTYGGTVAHVKRFNWFRGFGGVVAWYTVATNCDPPVRHVPRAARVLRVRSRRGGPGRAGARPSRH